MKRRSVIARKLRDRRSGQSPYNRHKKTPFKYNQSWRDFPLGHKQRPWHEKSTALAQHLKDTYQPGDIL